MKRNRYSSPIKSTLLKQARLIGLLSLSLFLLCKHPVGPPDHVGTLKAEAGPDQAVAVGNYVELDGSTSDRGDGDTLAFRWTALEGNPVRVFVYRRSPRQTLGFVVEGTYRFALVVNNGIQDSPPDTVTIRVSPRRRSPFPDPALEVSVRLATKCPTGALSAESLSRMDSLMATIVFGTVTSLTGIEKCSNLSFLFASLQQIEDLSPLGSLVHLQTIYLDQNFVITDISPLANLIELRWLDINSNQIADIGAIRNMTKLVYFNAMWNPITNISVLADKTDLEELYLNDIPIGHLDVLSRLTKLKILFLSSCQISDLSPLAQMTDLEYLNVPWNHINNFKGLAGCTKLVRLYLGSNEIDNIDGVENLTSLDLLALDNNKITNILALTKNPGLGSGDGVFLSNNPLDSISVAQYIPYLRSKGVFVVY